MLPPVVFLPDAVITSILDNFVLLNTLDKVTSFVQPYQHLRPYAHRLLEILHELAPEFRRIAADRKAENAANLRAKKAADAARAAAEEVENSEGSAQDVEMGEPHELRFAFLTFCLLS
jgi:predicted RecB family endonuclease